MGRYTDFNPIPSLRSSAKDRKRGIDEDYDPFRKPPGPA